MSSKCDKIYTEKFLRRQYLELNKLVKRIAKENNTSIAPIYKRLKFYKIKVTNLGFTGMHHTEEWKKKRKIEQMGKNNSFYGKHFSRDWIKEQSKRMKGKGNGFYNKHHTEESKEKIRKKLLKRIKEGKYNLIPNKSEQKLNKLLHRILLNEYKFVGNFKFWIESFNPDFINVNGQKKIIELYGDYWHNLPDYKKRDKRRLKIYIKYGYQTLIIWQHELKDLNKLKTKILEFNNLKGE